MKQRNAVLATVAFLAYTAFSMWYSAQLPSATRAQVAAAHHAVVEQCAEAKSAGVSLGEQAKACVPEPLRREGTWLTFGMLILGSVMIGSNYAAHRAEQQ